MPKEKLDKNTRSGPSKILSSLIPDRMEEEEFRLALIDRLKQVSCNLLLVFTWRHGGHVGVLLTKEFWLFLLFGTLTWPLCLLSFVSLVIVWKPRISSGTRGNEEKGVSRRFIFYETKYSNQVLSLSYCQQKNILAGKEFFARVFPAEFFFFTANF